MMGRKWIQRQKTKAWHPFLLMLFFVLFAWKQCLFYFDFQEGIIVLIASWCLLAGFLWLGQRIAKKSIGLIALVFTPLLIFLLHYAALYYWIENQPILSAMGRHRFLIPVGFLCWGGWAWYVIRKKETTLLKQFQLYFNTLFVLLCLFEGIQIINGSYSYLAVRESLNDLDETPLEAKASQQPNKLPDIYYLLLDAHTSFKSLKDYWGYTSPFEGWLSQNGFYVASSAHSPFAHTAQTMPAIFNMQAVRILEQIQGNILLANGVARSTMKQSKWIKILQENRYKIYNLSAFDLGTSKRFSQNDYIPDPADTYGFLFQRTLPGKIWMDFGREKAFKLEYQRRDALKKIISEDLESPKFVYAHFSIPHAPYYFDREGNEYPNGNIPDMTIKQQYMEQLVFTDQMIQETLQGSLTPKTRPTICIIQGDHGFRYLPDSVNRAQEKRSVLAAFYFSDGNYDVLSDTFKTVETFKLIGEQYLEFSPSSHLIKSE